MPDPSRHPTATASSPAEAAIPAAGIHAADGTLLFHRDWGSGRPLLFLSGWTLASDMWGYQMEPLSRQGFRCIAYDRRGHGRSGDPGRGYDYDTLADDLRRVIAALDLDQVTLVAHSIASGEAVRYLTRYGCDRVSGLVLVAPAAIPCLCRRPDNPIGVEEVLFEQTRERLLEDFAGWAMAQAAPYFGPGDWAAAIDWTIGMMTRTSLQAALALSRIQSATDFRPELRALDCPTLILHGDHDASAPLQLTAEPAAAMIPGARLSVYEGAAHGLYLTHKARLNQDIAAFAGAGARGTAENQREARA